MIFKITQELIDKSKVTEGYRNQVCPIALSIKKEFPKKYVFVGSESIIIGDKLFMMPPIAKTFIDRYDFLGKAEPFELELDIDV
jgi:hypothetical protein